jgi:hypothetical protein
MLLLMGSLPVLVLVPLLLPLLLMLPLLLIQE